MKPRLLLYALEPLREIPSLCEVCSTSPPVLRYEFQEYGRNGEITETKGFCCWNCANGLLRKLERSEAQKWSEEEAALKVDEFDISAFHQNRLAAFGENVR
jgi:hypothetical protein